MTAVQLAFKTKINTLYLQATKQGLQSIDWYPSSDARLIKNSEPKNPAEKILLQTAKQLQEYFEGKRQTFDLKLDPVGTPFQKKVWSELQKIPFGKTLAYKDIAKKIHNPKAVRAVGTANGKNPFCIIIPCHRVIAADGTLGGYAGGLEMKKYLLDLEAAICR